MNFQIAILFFIVALVFSFAVYFVVTSMTTRESFDEAKAHRRKLMKEYKDQNQLAVDKHKDKKLKKIKKKVKAALVASEKSAEETEVRTETDEPPTLAPAKKTLVKTDQASIKETIPEPKPEKQEKTKVTKKPRAEAAAPPKSDVTPGISEVDGITASSNAPPSKSKNNSAPPQNKVNKDKRNEKKVSEQQPLVDRTEVKPKGEVDKAEVDAVIQEKTAPPLIVEAVSKNQAKAKKKKTGIAVLQQLSSEKESVNINLLVSLVDKAELSRSEIQYLIDSLLNKQQSDVSEWSKGKQDPQAKLQKQLSETEKLLQEEKQAALGFQIKLKELRNELNKERVSGRQNEEAVVALQNERKTLSSKLQKEIEQNQTLASQIEQLQKQLREEQLVLMKIKEEQQMTNDQCHEAVGQLASQNQELQSMNNTLRNELAVLQKNLAIQDVQFQEVSAELERVISSSQFENNRMRSEMVGLERALGEIRIEYDNLSGNLNNLKVENQTLREQNEKYLNQYNSLVNEVKSEKERNESLNKKLSETWENGYSCNNKQEMLEQDARLEENESLLKALKSEIDAKNKQIEELTTVHITSRNEAQKKQSLLDAADSEISVLRLKNAELIKKEKEAAGAEQLAKEKEVSALKAEIASLKAKCSVEAEKSENGNDELIQLKATLNDKEREMVSLRNELEQTKTRNNELRNKNWKVAEALANAEKSLQTKMLSEQSNSGNNTSNDSKIKIRLQHLITNICPDVIIDDNKKCGSIEEWLDYVEDRVTLPSCSSSENNKEKQTSSAENAYLLNLNKRYRNIITETEGILNRLQNDVEVEESRWRLEQIKWKLKISELEEEVERLKQNQKDCRIIN